MRGITHPVFGTQVPGDWETVRVDDIRSPERSSCVAGPFGSNISSKYFADDGVPVIRGGNLTDDLTPFISDGFVFVSAERAQSYKAQHVRAGDLVFTCWGTIGQVGRIPDDGPYPEYIISNKQLKLRPDPRRTDSRFLYYYFANPQMVEHIRGRAIGSAVPGINLGILKELPVVLPPLSTQRKIAAVLSTYDRLIENNNQRIKILEEMAQRIYREWFVDFHYPGHDDVPLVESELGAVPKGWELQPFAALGHYVNGFAFKPADWGSEGLPIIKIRELKNGITRDTPRYAGTLIPKYEIHDGDVLFSWSADLNAYLWSGGAAWLNQHLFRVDPAPQIPRAYLFHALKERMGDFRARAQGTTMRHIKRAALDQVFTVLPPEVLSLSFAHLVEPLDTLVLKCVTSTRYLREARDFLLPRLISGELDVEHLDIQVPQAA